MFGFGVFVCSCLVVGGFVVRCFEYVFWGGCVGCLACVVFGGVVALVWFWALFVICSLMI